MLLAPRMFSMTICPLSTMLMSWRRFQALASRNWTSNCWEITKLLHVDHGDPSILNPPPSAMSNPSVSPNPKRTSSIFRTSSRASLSPSVTGSISVDFGSSSIHAFLLKAFEGHPNVVGSVGKYTEVFVKEKADDIEQILGLEEDALKGFCENGLSPAIPAWPRYQILSELLKMKRARGANGNSKAEESF
ncbi:hypothetical protein BT69DRAFT_394416 [Atractiella rhizophila]|nr:hypothetical protein BT69DRAFT_394416 [Atractiella rhizophila]